MRGRLFAGTVVAVVSGMAAANARHGNVPPFKRDDNGTDNACKPICTTYWQTFHGPGDLAKTTYVSVPTAINTPAPVVVPNVPDTPKCPPVNTVIVTANCPLPTITKTDYVTKCPGAEIGLPTMTQAVPPPPGNGNGTPPAGDKAGSPGQMPPPPPANKPGPPAHQDSSPPPANEKAAPPAHQGPSPPPANEKAGSLGQMPPPPPANKPGPPAHQDSSPPPASEKAASPGQMPPPPPANKPAPPAHQDSFPPAGEKAGPPAHQAPSPPPANKPGPPSDGGDVAPPPSYAKPPSGGHGLHSDNDHMGITYSPYRSTDGACKTAQEVMFDLAGIKGAGFTTIRLYAAECNALETVGNAAKQYGLRIIMGVFVKASGCDINTPDIKTQIDLLVAWNSWELVALVVVGNEAIMNGFCSPQQLSTLLVTVKAKISGKYTGQFTISETLNIWQRSDVASTMCGEVDIVGANIQPYFNPQVSAAGAGQFVKTEIDLLGKVCPGGKGVVNLECGWPAAGASNGLAIAGEAEQAAAISSIRHACGYTTVFFTLYPDHWKGKGACGCEDAFSVAAAFGIKLNI